MSGTTAITPSVTFGGQVGSIALSLLDTNFTQVATFLNNANNYSNYLVDTGAANSIVVTTPTSVTATYTAGLLLAVKVIAANTGASTINVNSLGLKNILNPDGSALASGQMPINSVVGLVYDGTQFLLAGGGLPVASSATTATTATTATNIAGGTKGQVPVQSAAGTTTFMDSSFAFKNRIINGGMALDQRNAGASQTITAAAALAYTVDRWYAYCTGANVTGQQIAGAYTSSQYRYQFTGAASVTTIGFGQRIEAKNSFDLANTTATLSCYISNSLLTTVTWTAYYANTADTFGTLASPTVTQIATGTFTVTSTRTQYSTNISIPSAATTGIQIVFTVGAQTSGTWVIDNIQLEKGSIATSFDYRSYGTELTLCQRYFETSYNDGTAVGNTTSVGAIYSRSTGTQPNIQLHFKVSKRTTPTMTYYAPGSGTVANFRNTDASSDLAVSGTNGTGTWGATPYANGGADQTAYAVQFTASAEL